MAERYLKNSLILSAVLLLPSLVNSNSDIFKSFLLRVDELNLVKEEVSVQREMVENLTRVVEVQEQLLLQQNVDMRLGKLENKASAFFTVRVDVSLTIAKGETVKFDNIINNEGGGYSVDTGMFTAPVNGTYLFSAHAFHNLDMLILHMIWEDAYIMQAQNDEQEAGAGSCSAVLRVNQGDHVYVRLPFSNKLASTVTLYSNNYFTGVLIHEEF